jgi:biopolymer transport protein ExbD
MTVLVDEAQEKIHCYFGEFKPNVHLFSVSLSQDGLRKLLFEKQDSAPVVIKTGEKARYETVVDVIDELNISQTTRYAIADMSEEEQEMLDAYKLTAENK